MMRYPLIKSIRFAVITFIVMAIALPFTNANNYFDFFENYIFPKKEIIEETNSNGFLKSESQKISALKSQLQVADCEEAILIEKQLGIAEQNVQSALIERVRGNQAANLEVDPGSPGPCPQMEVLELLGIPGFAETNELVMCGKPDTLAFLIYIEEPGNVGGTQMTVDFQPGMQYAGFESTHYAGTDISIVDPNPDKPRFLLDGITDGVFVGYIGVNTNCDADIDALTYGVNLKFNFVYEDTCGNFQSCTQLVTPLRTYNTIIKKPVTNWQSTPNPTITQLGVSQCTNVTFSQDGIGAYLEEMDFAVCGIDFTQGLQLTDIKANGTAIPYTYDAGTQTLSTHIDGSYFPGNSSPNPSDTLFNENERVTMQLCFQVDDCPITTTYPIKYKMSWGCNDKICQAEDVDREIRIRPALRPEPIAEALLTKNPAICGDPGEIDLKVYGDNDDPKNGLFTDITVGFETCNKPSLDIIEVSVNGTVVPPSTFSWVNDDINIDFTGLTFDPDGPGGLTDFDGDGFFDDMPGGDTLKLKIKLAFVCILPDAGSIECGVINCDFAQFYVAAARDCGQTFKFYPAIPNFNITNGGTYVNSNETAVTTSYFGIDFAATGTSGAKTKPVEICYVYEQNNVTACDPANSTNTMQVIYSGNPYIVHDVEIDDLSSIVVTVNDVIQPVVPTISWDSIDKQTRALNIFVGSNNIGDTVCIKYDLTVDTAACIGYVYMVGTHQVIETCDDGGCTCEIIKACEDVTFRSNPNDVGCSPCAIRGTAMDVYRESTGYTDETMTTKLIAPDDLDPADRNRYLPCDTMNYTAALEIVNADALTRPYLWLFGLRTFELGGGGTTVGNIDLQIDSKKSEIVSFSVKKAGGALLPVDFSALAGCVAEDPSINRTTNFYKFVGSTPWDATQNSAYTNASENSNSGYDHYDNSRVYFGIRNLEGLETCRRLKDPAYNNPASYDSGNCLDDLISTYNIEVGDSLIITTRLVFTKNPFNVAMGSPPTTAPRIYMDGAVQYFDEFTSSCVASHGFCREDFVYETYCPGEISAVTDLIVDDCGGTVEHVFKVDNTTPVNWYENEFRPYFQMQDIDIPIYSPLMFCGNAKAITADGTEYPLPIKDAPNHDCATVGGQLYCSVSGGSPGTIVLNPFENGTPALGVGQGGFKDELKITYDLCMVCPGELTGLSDYTLKYDYKLPCDPPDSRCYLCNGTTAANTEIPICLSDIGNGGNWYDYFNLDTLTFKNDVISQDVTIDQSAVNGFAALSSTLDKGVVSSGTPGSSEEINCFTITADADPTKETHVGVMALITVSNSVMLTDIYDQFMASLGPPILVSSTATTNSYRVSLPNLAPGDTYKFNIGTTLLFCPFPPLPPPDICVSVTSGCMDPDIQAAVAGNATGCNGIQECYKYVFGEAGIQSDILSPAAGTSYPLCGEIPVAFLIKNVKAVTVTDITASLDLPPGAYPVLGSFEASYPNNGDLSGATPFYSIANPTITGNNLYYGEDNDFSNSIHSNGFPGVISMADSNNVVIRFMMKTECDEFTSGSQIGLEAQAVDPCSPDPLTGGYGLSDRIIIDGANPADYAQILTTAKPAEAYCGGLTNTFRITGLNISEVPSGDSILLCITIPEELEYQTGSLQYLLPAGQPIGLVTETMIGNDLRLCFAGVNNLPVGGQFTFAFDAKMKEDAACGEVDLGVEIKELIEDQVCVDGGECDVFVNTSVNPFFGIDLKGPIETAELNFSRSCSGGDDPVTLCYEVKLHNPGPDYTGDITFNLHDDITANNILDFYDPIMDTNLESAYFIPSGDTVTINGCFEVAEINACPVILDIVYETDCACDHTATPYFQVSPGFLDNVSPTTVLCPDQELGFEYCGDYTFTLDPPADGYTYFSSDGDSVYFGLNAPATDLSIKIDGVVGECPSSEFIFIKGLIPFEAYLADTLACKDQPKFLQVVIPPEYEDYASIKWTPNTFLSADNISDPVMTADAPGLYDYDVTITFGDGCVFVYPVTVNVFPIGEIAIGGETEFCLGYEPANLTSEAGFDVYEWYKLDAGFEIIQAVTTTPAWTGPTAAGDYIVKGYRSADLCPSISPVWTVNAKGCVDLELEKEICDIDPIIHLGDSMTYCITVCNRLNPDSGLIYTVNDLEVGDVFPANLTYLGYSATEGTYIPNTPESTWSIPHMAAGECETIEIYARFDQEGTFENVAEITQSDDYDDVDSEEDNDDGDQSEDDEDKESVTIVFPKADIGNYVWKDLNQDGIQDTGEPAMSGVQVTLFDANTGLPVGIQITDAAGEYYFRDIQFGDYYLDFDLSGVTAYAECVVTTQDSGSDDAKDSDVLANSRTSIFTFDPSVGDDFDFDAGFHLKCEPTEASINGGN